MTTYDKSPTLGLNLPKGTDTFDYDVFLRQNFNTLDSSLAEITTESAKSNYSAKGDGVTNDTIALQNAALSGKNVRIPSGTYVINGTLDFNPYTRFIAKGKVTFKIISDVTVIKLCYKNQVEGIDFDVTSVVPYTKDVFEISSATMQGKSAWDWKVDIKINRVSLTSANPSSGVTGTFFNIWAARLDPDGVTTYDRVGFWGINIKEVDLNGYFGYFCRDWAYQATGVTDDGWITGIHFENVNIDTARYGFFGSRSEADMTNLLFRDCGNLVLDNVQMQCNGSKRFAFFSSLGKNISNTTPWDWQKSNPLANPILIQYRTDYSNSKVSMDFGYGNYDTIFDVNNAPSYMSTREKTNWVKSCFSNYNDSFNGQMTGRVRAVPFYISGSEPMPCWIKIADYSSKNTQFTLGFLLNMGYYTGNFGNISVALTVSDPDYTNQSSNPNLYVTMSPYVPSAKSFDFYVSKTVQTDGNTTYKVYMKLTTNTLGAGFYYTPFTVYSGYNAPVHFEKLSSPPVETTFIGTNKNVLALPNQSADTPNVAGYEYYNTSTNRPKWSDGTRYNEIPPIQSSSVQANATAGVAVTVTFPQPFANIPRVVVTPRNAGSNVTVATASISTTGFTLYCSVASIYCDYIAVG